MQATIKLLDEPEKEIQISVPTSGLRSECLKQARAEVSDHLTAYLSKNNLSKEEVNVMEEVISDGDEPSPQSKKGKQKKKADKRKRTS